MRVWRLCLSRPAVVVATAMECVGGGAEAIRVLVVDDHPIIRRGLLRALRDEPDMEVVGEAGDATGATAIVREYDPDVAVVDLLMPGVSGVGLTYELRESCPDCTVLGLSCVEEPGLIADMLRAGASGFVLKSEPVDELVAAIRTVAAGRHYLSGRISCEAIARELASAPHRPLEQLTSREREIFELVIRGYANAEIAQRLAISPRTVETHRVNLMRKLSARSVIELQRIAARYGGL
jgi:DNA-binding NarL/FixJ family response regulator